MRFGSLKSFNPSQVGYKLNKTIRLLRGSVSFNPSQVGYKLAKLQMLLVFMNCFNPSQVGYKLLGGTNTT